VFVFLWQVHIGYAEYNCLCVRYVTSTDLWLIVGLAVGLGLLLIIIIVIIIIVAVVCCRRCNKARENNVNGGAAIELDRNDRQHCITPAAETDSNNPIEYCNASTIEADVK